MIFGIKYAIILKVVTIKNKAVTFLFQICTSFQIFGIHLQQIIQL